MKFSGNLFKIQTKISVSAFILMSAVSGAVFATEDGESESDTYVQRGSVFTPPKGSVKGEEAFSPDSGDFVKAISKQRVRPNNNTKPPAGFRPRGGGNPEQKGSGLYSAIEVQVKASPDKFGMAIAKKSKIAGTILENYKKKRASRPNSEVQTDELTELPPFSEVLAAWRDASQGDLQYVRQELVSGVLYPSPRKAKNMTRDVVEEVVEEVVSPGVKRREEEESIEIARQRAVASQKLDFSEGDALVARGGLTLHGRRAAIGSDVLDSYAKQLNFSEELALVSGDVSSIFQPGSVLTVSTSDEVMLSVGSKEMSVRIEDLLTDIDVKDANADLSYWDHYARCLPLDPAKRKKYLKKALALPAFSGQTEETVWAFLEGKVISAAQSVPSFLKTLVQKDKKFNALVRKFSEDSQLAFQQGVLVSQQNSILRSQNQALVQALRHAFNDSELSKMFATDSTEMVRFDTRDWSTEQFSACLQLLVNQFIESQKSNTSLSSANEKLSKANDRLSSSIESLSNTGSTQALMLKQLSDEKIELERQLKILRDEEDERNRELDRQLRILRDEKDEMERERLTLQNEVEQLKEFKKKILKQLEVQQGKPFLTDLLRKINK